MIVRHTGRLLVIACLLATACSTQGELLLDSGAELGTLAAAGDSTVMILYDPSDCFSCNSSLASWIELRREFPDKVAIVFTRKPSAIQQKRLVAARVEVDGTLATNSRVLGFTPTD